MPIDPNEIEQYAFQLFGLLITDGHFQNTLRTADKQTAKDLVKRYLQRPDISDDDLRAMGAAIQATFSETRAKIQRHAPTATNTLDAAMDHLINP